MDKELLEAWEIKYNLAQDIFLVFLWVRYGVRPAKYSGFLDEEGDPITIQYSDHNGTYESYYYAPWYYESTGNAIAYFFNEEEAKRLASLLNEKCGWNG